MVFRDCALVGVVGGQFWIVAYPKIAACLVPQYQHHHNSPLIVRNTLEQRPLHQHPPTWVTLNIIDATRVRVPFLKLTFLCWSLPHSLIPNFTRVLSPPSDCFHRFRSLNHVKYSSINFFGNNSKSGYFTNLDRQLQRRIIGRNWNLFGVDLFPNSGPTPLPLFW